MGVMRLVLAIALLAGTACGKSKPAHAGGALDLAAWVDASLAPADAAQRDPDLAALTAIYPVRYRLSADGGLEPVASHGLDALLERERPEALRVVPTIQNLGPAGFDADLARKVLVGEPRDRLIDAIVTLVDAPTVDGVNIDFEGLGDADRAAFTAFLEALRGRLKKRGLLTVCVAARTAQRPTWEGARFVDWAAVGGLVDEVHVMAYDYSWPASEPGPVSPLSWFEGVVDYAVSQVPAERLRIGLPLYGYLWAVPREGPAVAVALKDLDTLDRRIWKPTEAAPLVRGAMPGKVVYLVTDAGDEVYIDDPESLAEKIAAAGTRGVTRFAFWHLGQAAPGTVGALQISAPPRRGR